MQLSDIYLQLGEERFAQLLRTVSMGRLRTFQLFDPLKLRLRMTKLSSETLRKAAPRIWQRLNEESTQDLAAELGQAILISHLDMIQAVLNELGIPHEEGFFSKDVDVSHYLTEGWQQRVWDKFQTQYPPAALVFYINHLAFEVSKPEAVFTPAAA
jgi:hypothetical protein